MIRVETKERFSEFVLIAKNKGVPYVIVGNEREVEPTYNFDKPVGPNKFVCTYVLSCQLFTVYFHQSFKMDEKNSVLSWSSSLEYIPVNIIKVSDGVIYIK